MKVPSLPSPASTACTTHSNVAPRDDAAQDFQGRRGESFGGPTSPPVDRHRTANEVVAPWWWACHNARVATRYIAKESGHPTPIATAPLPSSCLAAREKRGGAVSGLVPGMTLRHQGFQWGAPGHRKTEGAEVNASYFGEAGNTYRATT